MQDLRKRWLTLCNSFVHKLYAELFAPGHFIHLTFKNDFKNAIKMYFSKGTSFHFFSVTALSRFFTL